MPAVAVFSPDVMFSVVNVYRFNNSSFTFFYLNEIKFHPAKKMYNGIENLFYYSNSPKFYLDNGKLSEQKINILL